MYCVGKILGIIKIVFGWNALMILLKVMKSILTNEQISYNLLSIPVECAKSLVQKAICGSCGTWGITSFVWNVMGHFSF